MEPTVAAQLRAIRRLVDEAGADAGLGEAAAQALTLASSQLRRLEGAQAERLPFLVEDNRAAAALLAELAELVADLAPPEPSPADPEAATSEAAAASRNDALRELLARAVHELPADAAGDAARARVAELLRARLARNPALNRPPRSGAERTGTP